MSGIGSQHPGLSVDTVRLASPETMIPDYQPADQVRKNNLLCFPLVLWMNHESQVAREGGQFKDPFGDRLINYRIPPPTSWGKCSCKDKLKEFDR